MATYVEVGRTGILIDPGATLAPARFGLPPTAEEEEALGRARDRIAGYAARAQIVFVSHYHEDHVAPAPEGYAGRRVLAKDPRRMVQGMQARRAGTLWAALRPVARLESADGRCERAPDLELRVSPPLPHGAEGTPLGAVLALTVVDPAERERFVFASDVLGPLSPVATAYLIQERPTLLYLSGPPTYLEHELGAPLVERGITNLLRIVETTGCRVIVDHHAARETRFVERLARLWATGRAVTAAEHLGLAPRLLEAGRHRAGPAVRKPGARAGEARAMIAPERRRLAKGGPRP
jgi:hypothetical protein